ncbi:hypothetical protein [Amycolatopsis vancoresmycina]|uniref:SH3b domain-containing protein n=1 Tax=Amycolatopsis vancoresmycina DSM 44592 TaxID=1292037 RepID=R1HX40_9PSEU|nr:hypothetical protein [Amycolatopsis vancoresmycina]EOD64896.1 hypothetical protein H480_29476 [Amycolatopsis vancoresmycina DSM 44592]
MRSAKNVIGAGVLVAAAICLGTPGIASAGGSAVDEVRWQCGADSVTVRSYAGGPAIPGETIGYGVRVNVDNHNDNVWWHINSPYGGYVLAQYFC